MTDQRDEASLESNDAVAQSLAIGGPPTISRRAVLRGATATVPTILTLTSGAALARSSNLIKQIDTASGDVFCLNTAEAEGPLVEGSNVFYDLGAPPVGPYGEVTQIPTTYQYQDSAGNPLSPAQVCDLNGTVHIDYDGTGYTLQKTRTPGVMVSSSAVTSFGTRIITTDIKDLTDI